KKEMVLEVDYFKQAFKGYLLQFNNKSILYPIIYYLAVLSLTKKNYIIYNKELFTIIFCLKV
ncbi:uncharacterized protein TRIVIDRAFT_152680, partial [Trichoderma virens Gv29-8]